MPLELAALLQAHSRIKNKKINLDKVDYDVDVLIIGGGGAGASAAIEADNNGASTMIVTKLRIGDANTMMAEGGIQAADKPNDSPAQHYIDAFGGGHFAAKPELLYKLVNDAPEAIQWLNNLGVEFDKEPDGTMITTHGGGTSRKRMHAAKDYSGAEIMRTLRDEVQNRQIPIVDFTSAIELIKDEDGKIAGAVLMNMETEEILSQRQRPLSSQQAVQVVCIIRDSRLQTITAQLPTDWFLVIVQVQNFSMPTLSSTTRQVPHTPSRFSVRLLPRRFVLWAQNLSMLTARHLCIRLKPVMCLPLLLFVNVQQTVRAFIPMTVSVFGSILL